MAEKDGPVFDRKDQLDRIVRRGVDRMLVMRAAFLADTFDELWTAARN